MFVRLDQFNKSATICFITALLSNEAEVID